MNITNTIKTAATLALFTLFATARAESVSVLGPLEAVSPDGRAITVLGQTYIADKKEFSSAFAQTSRREEVIQLPPIGTLIAVQGERTPDGTQIVTTVRSVRSRYIPGATDVYLLGVAATYDASVAIAQIGTLRVYLGNISGDGSLSLTAGALVEIVGRQSQPGGVVWAAEARLLSAQSITGTGKSTQSITGTGVSAQSITGTGISTQSITGTGVSAQSITGTGVSAQSITGTGKSTQSITGTGVSAQSITGTGVSSQSITGTGVSAQSITGTGKSTQSVTGAGVSAQSITGTGVSSQSITGTGVGAQSITGTGKGTQSITGTGVSAQSITGTGKSTQSITGTGVNAQSITGTGSSIQSITGTGF